ncbi:ComF family protein [bacterium]|nr:ComF family protein [bacterium]MBU1989377.1 ComF family protein [bacterium]
MRCILCESFSFAHICSTCQETFLTPSIYRRKILNATEVISFYKYSDIKELLLTKHTDLGFYIYKILAKNSLKIFANEFEFGHTVASIAVDDHAKNGYSHTAVLNQALKCKIIKPYANKLRDKNRISYAGKSREFRLLHPRDFEFKGFREEDVLLVDDIITTGLTFTHALNTMQKNNKNVLFCLALADANLK